MGNETESDRLKFEARLREAILAVDPSIRQLVVHETIARLRREKFKAIKGGCYEPKRDTLKGKSTL